MKPIDLQLDVATPEQVSEVLRRAAQNFAESHSELAAAWQDDKAGRVWTAFASILNRAADQCDKAIARHV